MRTQLVYIMFGIFIFLYLIIRFSRNSSRRSYAAKRDNSQSGQQPSFLSPEKNSPVMKLEPGEKRCSGCNGTGKTVTAVKCTSCNGFGKKTCTSCGGSGGMMKPVNRMGQNTMERVNCMSCNGSGRSNCMSCAGSGKKSSTAVCATCKGSGKING